MKKRVITAIIIAVVAVPLLWLGGWFTFLLSTIICGCSIYEILKTGKGKNWSIAVYIVTILGAFFLTYWSVFIKLINGSSLENVLDNYQIRINIYIIIAFLIGILTVEFASKNFDINTCFYLFTMTLFISMACQGILMIRINLEKQGIAYVIVTTIVCDIFAHLIGTKFGKHQLAPILSPKKTIEGAIAGVIASTIIGFVLYLIIPFTFQSDTINNYGWIYVLILSFFLGIGAVIGDLIFSSIKRQSHIKDFSDLLPGHGGMLDRVDSLLFNVLIFMCYYDLIVNGVSKIW